MELLDAERTGYVDWDTFTRVLLSLAPKRLLRADVAAFMEEQVLAGLGRPTSRARIRRDGSSPPLPRNLPLTPSPLPLPPSLLPLASRDATMQ